MLDAINFYNQLKDLGFIKFINEKYLITFYEFNKLDKNKKEKIIDDFYENKEKSI